MFPGRSAMSIRIRAIVYDFSPLITRRETKVRSVDRSTSIDAVCLDEPPFSLIAHSSVEFGAKHIEDDKAVVGEQIRDKIFEFLPELPREFSSIKYHKWKYSQVEFGCLLLTAVFTFV